MATIYRKTSKGLAEVETRAHRLSPRLRAALILVDGKRSVDELRGLIAQQAEESLAALHEQGFVEPAAAVPPAAPEREPAVTRASPASTASERTGEDFATLKRRLVRSFNDLTGPTGEVLAIRLEKAADRRALGTLLPAASEFVASVRGSAAADEFKQRYVDQLEAA